jgi:predicted phage baseplate assembly protein
VPVPLPTLDDKQFDLLVDEARLLIPRHAPVWTDHNLHDPGMTLIELLAWLAEMQIYTLDQITDRHRQKFISLLGTHPKTAVPARALVTFSFDPGRTEPMLVEKRTPLIGQRARTNVELTFETERDLWIVPLNLVRIRRAGSLGQNDLTEAYKRGPYIYPFGGESAVPIQAGNYVAFGFDKPFPPAPSSSLEMTFAITLYEADLPAPGAHGGELPDITPSAEVQWEYLSTGGRWLALPVVVDETAELTSSGLICFTSFDPADPQAESEGLYWIRCRLISPGYEIPPRISAIHLNAVMAEEAGSVAAQPVCAGTGLPLQRVRLGAAPIVPDSLVLEIQEASSGPFVPWQRVHDFDASGPSDRHFVLDANVGEILFGNGARGRLVPKLLQISGTALKNIRASYRVGGGVRGNLEAGEINRIKEEADFEDIFVTNPQPAAGGTEAESIPEALRRIRDDLTTPYRAATSREIEALAKATPGLRVARAKAIPGFDAAEPASLHHCVVTVVVVPYSFIECPVPSKGFLKTVCRHLDRHRLITTDLRIIAPQYVAIFIDADVTVKAKSAPADVRQRVEDALAAYFHPLHGGAQGTGWPFGRSIFRSETANLIERVEGVECLTRLQIRGGTGAVQKAGDLEIPKTALICGGQFRIAVKEKSSVCEVKPCPSPA